MTTMSVQTTAREERKNARYDGLILVQEHGPRYLGNSRLFLIFLVATFFEFWTLVTTVIPLNSTALLQVHWLKTHLAWVFPSVMAARRSLIPVGISCYAND